MVKKIKTVFAVPTVAFSRSRCVVYFLCYAIVVWRRRKTRIVEYELDESYVDKIRRENYV